MSVSSAYHTWRGRIAAIAVLCVLAALAISVPARGSTSGSPPPATLLTVDATGSQATVSKAVLGHAYLWPFAGMGSFNSQSDQFYGQFVHQLRDVIQPGSLRWPGGITGETFHWQRAIGPQDQRTPNAFGPSQGPNASTVGPDEFGQLLDQTGATGIGTAAFATGSAAEAAAFVSYMTASSGPWAQLRARNGHPAPYNVPYWEVGNEENQALYWRGGTPVSVGGPPGACQNVVTCLYIYGGSTQFTKEPAVLYADRTPQASHSTGAAHQQFYVDYPPVAPNTATVYVDGTQWTQVTSMDTAGPGDHVYVLDPSTGEITFGDGTHGAVPPAGAQVTVSYVSGPHDGFVQYYQAMKAANPNVHVCSADESADFVASMGSTLPYDCLQHHGTYVSVSDLANDLPIDQYQQQIMAAPDNEAQQTAALQADIEQHAGHPVPLVITEYGQLLSSNPDGYPYYHDSLDEALLNASQLTSYIRAGIPVADRQLLTAEIPPPDQCCAGLPGAAPFATTGAIGTPGPHTVTEATGLVYNLFAPLRGGTVLPSTTAGNPVLTTVGGQAVNTLDAITVRSGKYVYLIGINRSTTDAVSTRVLLKGARADGPAAATLLDGPSSLSYNSPAAPQTVQLSHSELPVSGRGFDVTFPAHSAMAVRLPVQ